MSPNSEAARRETQLAVARYRAGDFAGALQAAEAALGAEPCAVEALHLKAMALGRLGRIVDARTAFEEAARKHPEKAAVLSNYGNALRQAGAISAAAEAYRNAIEADPRLANAWYNLGLAHYDLGALDEAAAAFNAALAIDPAIPGAWTALGVLKARREMYDDALACFDRALAVRPDHASALVHRGRTLANLGRVEEALRVLGPVASDRRASAEAVCQNANALRLAGRLQEAASEYRRALRAEPFKLDAHRDLARLIWETGDRAGFLEHIDTALSSRLDPGLLELKGDLAHRAGQIDAAEAAGRKILEVVQGDARGLALVARARHASGDPAGSVYYARMAHEAEPENYAHRHQYAEALLGAGSYTEARDLLAGGAPRDHLQKQVGLRALALRAQGDPEYQRWFDYDRLAAQVNIDPPPGYSSTESFNADFADFILSLHKTTAQPIDQTLYGGTQSFGRLWSRPEPIIAAFKQAMIAAARRYVDGLPDDPTHEFLAQKSKDLACAGAWSVVLSSGGGHVDHIHPAGWISACYYVAAPPETLGTRREGHLRLGASGVRGLALPAERYFAPRPGSVVIFPSYIWHGVETFAADAPRITAPFDLAPAARPAFA